MRLEDIEEGERVLAEYDADPSGENEAAVLDWFLSNSRQIMRRLKAAASERARADKAEAELAELMEDAFDAGFEASGEGWNGEYPGDAMTRDYYKVARNETLRRLARAVKSAAPATGLEGETGGE